MRSVVLVLASLLLAACVAKSDLDQAKSEVERLNAKVAQLEQESAEKSKKLEDLEAALKQVAGKAAAMESELSRKPAIPVQASLRRALIGSGYVLVLSTTVKKDFPVLVTIKSKALGTSKQVRANLTASGTTELGSSEGVAIDIEDEVLIENTNFETGNYHFKAK